MSTYTNEQVAHLVDGTLDWETTFRMLSMPKDTSRFVQYLAALQAKVKFKERIVLPLGPHLYIVQSTQTKQWVNQCDCGHVFCDYREYCCPTCGTMHDVEAPTPWYPVIHDFEPDIEAFYKEWVNLPLPERAN